MVAETLTMPPRPPYPPSETYKRQVAQKESQPSQAAQRQASKKKGDEQPQEEEFVKYESQCFKLNNNEMEHTLGLRSVVEKLFINPATVCWIDLSFNKIKAVDEV